MRRTFLRLASLAAIATLSLCMPAAAATGRTGPDLVYDGVPEPADAVEDLDPFIGAREARLLDFTPQAGLLIATRFGEISELHLVERPLGERRQITFERDPIRAGALCPDPTRQAIAYAREEGGLWQIYYQKLGEPTARRLTDGKSQNGDPLWSSAGRAIAFETTARDGASHDIDLVEPESNALPRLLLAGDAAALIPLDWSPDDRKLLVLRRASPADGALFVVEVDTGKKREVDPSKDKVRIVDARFSRDGQGVYLISDRDGEFAKLRYVNLFTAERTELSGHIAGDVESLALSRDGHYLAYASNEGGLSRLDAVDLRAHQDLVLPRPTTQGIIGALRFDPLGTRLAFDLSSATRPRDVYVLDLEAHRLEPWTASEPGALDPSALASPHLVEFPTFDRTDGKPRSLPAWVYEPRAPGPHPVLIVLHDGPDGEFRPQFDPWLQYVVNELHYAVIAPNVRGSAGYGRTFRALGVGEHREDAVKDLGALIVWADLQGRFDPRHVVIAGQGEGGSLALAALINYVDRLAGAIDLGGITDFAGFLSSSPPARQDALRAEYGDERDPDVRSLLRRLSPLTNADRIARPLLIVHGRNDARVPISESRQLVARLRSRGAAVWYLEVGGEGHEFLRQSDREAVYGVIAQFLTSLR